MPRTVSNPSLRTKTQRKSAKIIVRRDPYWHVMGVGKHLGYRKIRENHGTWIARYYTPARGRRFESLGFADDGTNKANGESILSFEQAEAKAKEQFDKWEAEDAGVAPEAEPEPYTVNQAMDDYITKRESVKRKALTATRSAIRAHILPEFNDVQLADLTRNRIERWHERLATVAPRVRSKPGAKQAYRVYDSSNADALRCRQATANRILTILKAALNYAHARERIASKPWDNVKPFHKVDLPKVRHLTADEVAGLLKATSGEFRTLVRAALLTGCRYGELANMQVEHFDPQQEQVFVAESKNGEARHVELSTEGVALFQALIAGKNRGDWMFTRANGKQWRKSEQKRPMDEACKIAELEQVTFHILRHTYASHLAMNGTTIRTIADQLGHKDTRITDKHYAHLSRSHVRESIRKNLPAFAFDMASQ